MTKSDMKKDLDALLDLAKDLPEESFEKLPDGNYIAVIDKVGFGESKAGNYMFSWEFIVSEGKHTKQHEWKYTTLNKPENMKRLMTDLKKFGIDTEKGIDAIEGQLEHLIDVEVDLEIKTSQPKDADKQPFRNVNVKPCNS